MTFWAFALFKAVTQEQQTLPIKLLHIIMPLSRHSKWSHLALRSFVSFFPVTHVCSPLSNEVWAPSR